MTTCSADFGDQARFRLSVLRAEGSHGMMLRQIPNNLFTLAQIGLPDKIKELISYPRGLILVTGPTGSGKSTTLASMINWINEHHDGHIITIEDPIEYYYQHKQCIVTQREVGNDVASFADAIRGALRQDSNVIVVGEMRDLETIKAAVGAAETSHLVFATLNTTGTARTIDWIVEAFPADMKDQIRTQLASSVVAVISQSFAEGRWRAYCWIEHGDDNFHRAAHPRKQNLPDRLRYQTGAVHGMISLNAHLLSLYNRRPVPHPKP